jgi:hypothetical protein
MRSIAKLPVAAHQQAMGSILGPDADRNEVRRRWQREIKPRANRAPPWQETLHLAGTR